jgi:hypothetical protein
MTIMLGHNVQLLPSRNCKCNSAGLPALPASESGPSKWYETASATNLFKSLTHIFSKVTKGCPKKIQTQGTAWLHGQASVRWTQLVWCLDQIVLVCLYHYATRTTIQTSQRFPIRLMCKTIGLFSHEYPMSRWTWKIWKIPWQSRAWINCHSVNKSSKMARFVFKCNKEDYLSLCHSVSRQNQQTMLFNPKECQTARIQPYECAGPI